MCGPLQENSLQQKTCLIALVRIALARPEAEVCAECYNIKLYELLSSNRN